MPDEGIRTRDARYAHEWKPRNLFGAIYYDPREELQAWADSTEELMVAVPVATLRAAAALRECDATTVMTGDEDGPLPSPVTIRCRRAREHTGMHGNGYTNWEAGRG